MFIFAVLAIIIIYGGSFQEERNCRRLSQMGRPFHFPVLEQGGKIKGTAFSPSAITYNSPLLLSDHLFAKHEPKSVPAFLLVPQEEACCLNLAFF